MLLKKTKKHASISERSFSVGAIAESIQPLSGGNVLAPFLPHILPMFADSCRDSEDDCRNNAVFGLGELLLWAGAEISQHREQILMSLSGMLKVKLHIIGNLSSSPNAISKAINTYFNQIIDSLCNEVFWKDQQTNKCDKDDSLMSGFLLRYCGGGDWVY